MSGVWPAIEDGHGNTRVSREKAIKQEVWKRIDDCLAKDSILKGLITGSVKGGMTVDVQGIKAFLPGSLADVIPTKDLEHLVGNYEEFKVIKLDKDKNNVVLSRKAVLQEANSEEREKLLAKRYCFSFYLNPAPIMGRYRSGQTGQTVNLLAMPSEVRILSCPPWCGFFRLIFGSMGVNSKQTFGV